MDNFRRSTPPRVGFWEYVSEAITTRVSPLGRIAGGPSVIV